MRVLITLDAVGGVWRYGLDLARGLEPFGVNSMLVGFGPEPNAAQRDESGGFDVVWTGEPLDWMVRDDQALEAGSAVLTSLAADVDVLHLNLPSQAAGLPSGPRVVVASHSCVPTWWDTVRGGALPEEWRWQKARNLLGFQRAAAILAPSESHAAALGRVYGGLRGMSVVHNATGVAASDEAKDKLILGVGRWWDDGKNGAVLNDAALSVPWPIVLAGPGGDEFRNVRRLGPLPHGDVLAWMRRAAIFAAPSRYEPFGLAVAEAAISGAALVLADIPTFRELWNGAAVFVPAGNAAAWSQALTRLAADRPRRRELAERARSRAAAFTLQRQAARLFDVYTSVA